MNNKIIEEAIDEVVSKCPESYDFKKQFKTYLLNRLSSNYASDDLKDVLSLINVEAED